MHDLSKSFTRLWAIFPNYDEALELQRNAICLYCGRKQDANISVKWLHCNTYRTPSNTSNPNTLLVALCQDCYKDVLSCSQESAMTMGWVILIYADQWLDDHPGVYDTAEEWYFDPLVEEPLSDWQRLQNWLKTKAPTQRPYLDIIHETETFTEED